jgi:curved DNA-binding protein CbpA
MNPYEVLGVPPDADAAAIKKGYRRASAKAHPDRAGGDPEQMATVNRAMAVLEDPARRARFDKTGETGAVPDVRAEAAGHLRQVIGLMLDQASDTDDLVAALLRMSKNSDTEARRDVRALRAKLDLLARRRGYVECRSGDHNNLFVQVIDDKLKRLSGQISALERQLEINEAAREILQEYSWRGPAALGFGVTGTFG